MSKPRQIQINLLERDNSKAVKTIVTLLVVISLIIMGGFMTYIYWDVSQEISRQEEVNANMKAGLQVELKEKNTSAALLQSQKKIEKQITVKRNIVKEAEDSRVLHSDVLSELDPQLLPGILINNINVSDDTVLLKGFALDNRDVLALLEWLESNLCFKDIKKLSSTMNEQSGEISFDISIGWEERVE